MGGGVVVGDERERERERGRPGVCFPANYISVKSLHDTKISSFYVFGVSNGAVFFFILLDITVKLIL